jgi:hypothetical protein
MHRVWQFFTATTLIAVILLPHARAQIGSGHLEAANWTTFLLPEFGTRVEYPAGIFSVVEGKSEKGVGERLSTADGRASLSIYSSENETGETPASYLQDYLRMSRSALEYERVTRLFFAISAVTRGKIYYSRCNFAERPHPTIHCFDLVYPEREKRAWDDIVTRISRSLRPLQG